jgi:hypothetical protein
MKQTDNLRHLVKHIPNDLKDWSAGAIDPRGVHTRNWQKISFVVETIQSYIQTSPKLRCKLEVKQIGVRDGEVAKLSKYTIHLFEYRFHAFAVILIRTQAYAIDDNNMCPDPHFRAQLNNNLHGYRRDLKVIEYGTDTKQDYCTSGIAAAVIELLLSWKTQSGLPTIVFPSSWRKRIENKFHQHKFASGLVDRSNLTPQQKTNALSCRSRSIPCTLAW